jgi:signal transduction histidine kinase
MEVQDEGRGMQEGALKHGSGTPAITGVGIVGMRERVRQLGGELEIHSTPNGTTLKVVLPLNQG